ncbi:MAG: ABC transporter permease subunit [Dokdonella sp.]
MSALVIARHEWRRQLVQPFVWTLAAIVIALMAWQFLLALAGFVQISAQLNAQANAPGVTDLVAVPLLGTLSNLLLLIVPLLTMRSFAGERRAHTLPLLLAAGISDSRIVIGKYLGALGIVLAILALIVLMPLALGFGTSLDLGKLTAATLGLALFAAALTAIGVLCSAWTAQPALAAGAALALASVLSVLDLGARMQGIENDAINYFALPTHLQPFFRGIVASIDIVYFLLIVAVCLILATRRLNDLRWHPD